MARKKYNTTEQAEYWLQTIDTSCLNNGLSTYLQEDVISFIERMPYFFFSTSSANGNSNVNFKGSDGKKLIKVINNKQLLFPDFSGNGILHSMGDIYSNPNVGMLIIDFSKDIRLKINGKATIVDDMNIISGYLDYFDTFDIERLIEINIEYVIPNCSKNINVVRKSLLSSI
ncbi:MAG: pyridoxamine 5'-phosphate oxidase family protein [Campylobacterales bacterium]|nr:pyridoxamine 5'-phosphate oxidase family protein [Campylobacterales bacterium]